MRDLGGARRRIESAMEGRRPGVPRREMLESGTHATIAEIAAAEKINEIYVGRLLRLTLLAPVPVGNSRADISVV
jgi:hypothetical protein